MGLHGPTLQSHTNLHKTPTYTGQILLLHSLAPHLSIFTPAILLWQYYKHCDILKGHQNYECVFVCAQNHPKD